MRRGFTMIEVLSVAAVAALLLAVFAAGRRAFTPQVIHHHLRRSPSSNRCRANRVRRRSPRCVASHRLRSDDRTDARPRHRGDGRRPVRGRHDGPIQRPDRRIVPPDADRKNPAGVVCLSVQRSNAICLRLDQLRRPVQLHRPANKPRLQLCRPLPQCDGGDGGLFPGQSHGRGISDRCRQESRTQ